MVIYRKKVIWKPIALALVLQLNGQPLKAQEMTVTANRLDTVQSKVGSSIRVLNREAWEQTGVSSLPELLRQQPDLQVVQTGSMGSLTRVGIRGANEEHTQVMLDGMLLNDPSAFGGVFDFSSIDLSSLERVEILKGPQGALYGSNAMGGVIHLISRKLENQTQGYMNHKYSSYGTLDSNIGLIGSVPGLKYRFQLGREDSDGFSNASTLLTGATEKDGYSKRNFSMGLSSPFGKRGKLDLQMIQHDSNIDLDSGTTDETGYTKDELNRNFRLGLKWLSKEAKWEHEVSIQNRHQDRTDFRTRFNRADNTDSQRSIGAYKLTRYFDSGDRLLFGLEKWEEQVYQSRNGVTRLARQFAQTDVSYLNYQWAIAEKTDATFGLRRDKHDLFGSQNTGRVTLNYRKSESRRIFASWGSGFKAPTLNRLFGAQGNPNLKAEESDGYELGFENTVKEKSLKYGLTWFETDFENLIEFVPFGANPFVGTFRNIATASIRGVEGFASKACGDSFFQMNVVYSSPRDEGNQIDLRRRPRWSSTFQWELSQGKNTLISRARYNSKSNESNTIVDELGGYVTFDVNYLMPLKNEKFKLNLGVDNLFDKHYEVARSYGIPGRVLWVKLGTRF